MDLNHLLHRHQISLMRARSAASPEARFAHRGLASGYAARIAVLQNKLGVALPMMAA